MRDKFTVAWSGTMERTGAAPGLSAYAVKPGASLAPDRTTHREFRYERATKRGTRCQQHQGIRTKAKGDAIGLDACTLAWVLEARAMGESYEAIAEGLDLSEATVRRAVLIARGWREGARIA